MSLEIIYQDQQMVAINKPAGLLVHKTKLANDAKEFALQKLRDQIGQHVFPVHRLDRGTSGVLLFALDKETAALLGEQFRAHNLKKTYLAIVRGFVEEAYTVDLALKRESDGKYQRAVTHIEPLEKVELPIPVGKYKKSRYSLLRVHPETGRMHQIRRHLAGSNHPIIGDHPHGDHRHNKSFIRELGSKQLLLHAQSLEFKLPMSKEVLRLKAGLDYYWEEALDWLAWTIEQ